MVHTGAHARALDGHRLLAPPPHPLHTSVCTPALESKYHAACGQRKEETVHAQKTV